MKDKITANLDNPTLIDINGKKYKLVKETTKIMDHKLHGNLVVFEPFDEKAYKKSIDYILERIKDKVDVEEILRDVLNHMPLVELKNAEKQLRKKKPIKKTTGCLGFTIGDDSSGAYIGIS